MHVRKQQQNYQDVNMQHFIYSHKILSIKDTLDYPIINHLDEAIAWIHQQRKKGCNVLVHCHAGVSRSATIVLAYLIRTKNMDPGQALDYVRSKRSRVKPNINFWNQINQYYTFWLNASKMPQRRLSKNQALPENQASRPSYVSLPHKTIQSRLNIHSDIKKDKSIEKIKEIMKPDQNYSPVAQRKSIHNSMSNQQDKMMENSKIYNETNSSKISLRNKEDLDESKGQITKSALNKRKKIFDSKYVISKALKTQPIEAIGSLPKQSIKLQYQTPQKQERPSFRKQIQINSAQSHLQVNRHSQVFRSNIITPSQIYSYSVMQPQSVIVQRQADYQNRSSISSFPYNILPSEVIKQTSTYQVRQQSNVMSPIQARSYYS